jgi:hypothetical protein
MLPAERALMGAGCDRAHDPAAGLGRQDRIQGRADQLVAEQRHLLRPATTRHVVLFRCAHYETPLQQGKAQPGPAEQQPTRGFRSLTPPVRGNSCCHHHRGPPAANPVPGTDQPSTPRQPARPSLGRAARPARTGQSPQPSPPPTPRAGHATANRAPPAPPDRHRPERPPATGTTEPPPPGEPSPAAIPAPWPPEHQEPPRSADARTRKRGPPALRRSPRPRTPDATASSPATTHA